MTEQVETVEQFLARGGQVQHIPRGAMAEAGWTGKQFAQAITNTATAARKERVEAEASAKKAKPEKPERAPRRSEAAAAFLSRPRHHNGRDGSKTAKLLEAMGTVWRPVAEIAELAGLTRDHCSARLSQLREMGEVISHGQRPRMLWAVKGTERPEPVVEPPSEFDGVTTAQLLDKAQQSREQVRELQKLVVRIEREVKKRGRAARRQAACR